MNARLLPCERGRTFHRTLSALYRFHQFLPMYEIIREDAGRAIGIRASGTLTGDDLQTLSAYLDDAIREHGSIRILFEMDDFHGWTPEGAVRDLHFDLTHNDKVECVAMVGEAAWEETLTALMKPFAHAEVQYFDTTHLTEAWSWVRGKV